MGKKGLRIVNECAVVVTIAVNYVSGKGIFNGNSNAGISDLYQNLCTPAGYTSAIWGVVYLALLGFAVFAEEEALVQIGWWFLLSCIANSGWELAWLYGYTGLSVLIMAYLAYCLAMIVIRTDMEITDPPLRTIASVWWPFSLYAGWITIALIANIAALLTKTGWPVSEVNGTLALILLAGIVCLLLTWTRNMREYALVGVWGLVGIAVADWHKNPLVVKCTLIVSLVLFVSSSLHGYINRGSSPWKRFGSDSRTTPRQD